MPNWIPAKDKDGESICSIFDYSIDFQMQGKQHMLNDY